MKIKSIRLHPFAGINDKTYDFKEGLNIIFGANEEGKTTVAKAIKHALFLNTNLTPARKKELLRDLLPVAGGDTICITMKFLWNDCLFTLEKSWGATSKVSLNTSDGGVVITDNDSVQEHIQKMLPGNQAVVEQILIASQSKLAEAVSNLSDDVKTSLSEQLRAAILKGGGISGTVLSQKIDNETTSYFGRWDEATSKPEGGVSRESLNNRWINGAGRIVNAWYELKEAKETEAEIKEYETESGRLQSELNSCNESLKITTDYLTLHKAPYDAVNKRIAIEGEINKFQSALDGLALDASRWPIAETQHAGVRNSLENINQELVDLNRELDIARKKQDANKDADKLAHVNDAKKKIEEAEKTAISLVEIPSSEVELARKHQQEISRCKALIDGQKLLLHINPTVNGTIELMHSGGKKETLNFSSGEKTEKEISGSVAFSWQGVDFHILSANADIATLEASLNQSQTDLKTLLGKYNQDNIDNLIMAATLFKEAKTKTNQLYSNLQATLGSDSYESLTERCASAAALPGTRDIKVLEGLSQDKTRVSGQQHANLINLVREIENLNEKHVSREKLDERRMNGLLSIRVNQAALDALPPIPNGYDSAATFQQEYSITLNQEREKLTTKQGFETTLNNLSEPLYSLMDATEQARLAKGKFEILVAEGKAYQRIQQELKQILDAADASAFDPLHSKTESYLNRLSSGRFERIPFNITQPQQLEGNNIALPVSLLSKGTKDILALALRLAAAEVYMENNTGFVIMDDPLVDMDINRRLASAEVLKEFASTKQTIIFTCHEEHARLFDSK